MNSIRSRLLALGGLLVIWEILWTAAFAALFVVLGVIKPDGSDVTLIEMLTVMAGVGLVSGGIFALIAGGIESRQHILDLPVSRAALWGVVGASVYPLLTGREDQVFILGPIGAGIAILLASAAQKYRLEDGHRLT